MSHHTVTIRTSCLTTHLQYKLHVSPHNYHTNFMSHHTVTILCVSPQLPHKICLTTVAIQTLCLTTVTIQTSCLTIVTKLYVSPVTIQNFMPHHTVTIQSSCLTTQLPNFMSHQLPNFVLPYSYHTNFVSPQLPYNLHVSPQLPNFVLPQLPNFMSHHTVTIQYLCLTTHILYNLYVPPHSYQTLSLTTQLPYKTLHIFSGCHTLISRA